MNRILRALATCSALLIAAGCSGGGSTTTPTAPAKNNGSGGGTTQPSSAKVRGKLTLVIKSRAKVSRKSSGRHKREYVSPATGGIYATFTDTNSTTITYQGYTLAAGATQSATSPADCTALASDNSFTCTLYFQLSPDPYTIELDAYDTAQSGTSLSTGNALSTDTESVTVSNNTSNTFAFTLQGIVEGFNVSPQYVGASGPIAAPPSDTLQPKVVPITSATAQALDADDYPIDAVDTSTNFASGAQPSGPFVENTAFDVGAVDGDTSCSSSPCVSTTSTAVTSPASETLNFSYNGNGTSGDGTTVMPYFGVIGLTEPTGYATGGFTSATFNNVPYASEVYVVPFFGIVDPANTTGERTDATDVSFIYPGDTVNVYALQYHLPTGSAGYTIDTSNCGSIASATSPTSLATGYGASFALTAGSASGSCNVVLSDGATPADTATIHVVSTSAGGATVTVPCAKPSVAPDARGRLDKKRFSATSANECPPPLVLVADLSANAVYGYPLGANGNVTPTFVLGGDQTGLDTPAGVAVDSSGNIYVSNFSGGDVTVYSPGASGNVAPIRTLTGLDNPYDVAFDSSGNIYAANGDAQNIAVFQPGATTPFEYIGQGEIGRATGVAVDSSGNVYAGDQSGSSVEIFAAGATGSAPNEDTISSNGAVDQVALAPNGNLFVAAYNNTEKNAVDSIDQYAPGLPTGPPTQVNEIDGSATGLGEPIGVALGSDGTVFASSERAQSVTTYPAGSNGNVTPTTTIAGSDTGLLAPLEMTIASIVVPPTQTDAMRKTMVRELSTRAQSHRSQSRAMLLKILGRHD